MENFSDEITGYASLSSVLLGKRQRRKLVFGPNAASKRHKLTQESTVSWPAVLIGAEKTALKKSRGEFGESSRSRRLKSEPQPKMHALFDHRSGTDAYI